jgi:acyl-CoA synthetase (AMP-forming)/AMP-acid ligase II
MGDKAAILRGAECRVPEHATFASNVAELVRQYPLRAVVEIDLKNQARTLSVASIWANAQAIIERVQTTHSAARPVLVFCLDSFLDLIAAGWAAVAMDRDCHFWHVIEGHESSRNFARQWRELQSALGGCQLITRSRLLREFSITWESEPWPPICLDRLPHPKDDHRGLLDRDHDRGKVFVKTSGTTGTGKLAVIPYAVQMAQRYSTKPLQRSFSTLSSLPMDNITGLSRQFPATNLQVLISPAAVAIDPRVFLRAIERFGVEEFVASTSFALRLIRTLQRDDAPLDLSSLRYLSVGLEPISTPVFAQLIEELMKRGASDVRIGFGYGLTEVGLAAFSGSMGLGELQAQLEGRSGAFPLANCAPGRAIRVVDASGRPLGEDCEGEIQIHAPQRTIAGYLQAGGGLIPVKQVDGWVCSEDLGKITSRGLVITGRTKGIIFSQGKCIALDPVEQALRESGLVREGLVAAAPLEGDAGAGDYVVMFCPADENDGAETMARVRQVAASAIGIRPFNVVTLRKDRFVFTTTGKMRKRHMAQLYGRTEVIPPSNPRAVPDEEGFDRDPLFGELCALWRSILNLQGEEPLGATFFELGGSSITAVQFLHRAEQLLQMRLPAERFFVEPTLPQVWRLYRHDPGADLDDRMEAGHGLDRLRAHVHEWKGQRTSDDAFLRGFHTKGTRIPIFWVFQMEEELLRLAGEVGENQPLYGMRSLYQVVPIHNLSAPVLREVSNQYITEILAITQGRPFILGGNCQAAIVSLRMALALEQLGQAPATLVLMEWTYSWGRYAKPVVLLYGQQSYTAAAYESPGQCGLPWKHDFPHAVVHPIAGAHGEFFSAENVSSLSERLLELTRNA